MKNFIKEMELHIPQKPLNFFIDKVIKSSIGKIDIHEQNMDLFCKFFDKLDKPFDTIFRSKTLKSFLSCGLEVECVKSSRIGVDERRAILMMHGGGFISFNPRTHRVISSYLSYYASANVYVPNYTKSLKKKFPTQLNECHRTYMSLIEDGGYSPDNIFLVGDSAGGNLALSLALKIKDETPELLPAGVSLYSPWTDLTLSGTSIIYNAKNDNVIPANVLREVVDAYGADDVKHPYVSPLFGNFEGLCPVEIHCGSREILLDDSTRLYERLKNASVTTTCKIWKDQGHVFPIWARIHKPSRMCLQMTGEFINNF